MNMGAPLETLVQNMGRENGVKAIDGLKKSNRGCDPLMVYDPQNIAYIWSPRYERSRRT